MSAAETLSVVDMLAKARAGLSRLDAPAAHVAWRAGAVLVDIRPAAQRRLEGDVPGAATVERNVLEWRFDPASESRLPQAEYDLHVVVLCSEGYTSSLAAHSLQQLGLHRATDVIGGFQAWSRAGLPTTTGSSTVADIPSRLVDGPHELDELGEGVQVNRDQRCVEVGDRELDLTRLEFDLLAHLVELPRRVHTRCQLVDALWPGGTHASSRSLDVHVHRLRAKLGAPWADSLVTVRGIGYRWGHTT